MRLELDILTKVQRELIKDNKTLTTGTRNYLEHLLSHMKEPETFNIKQQDDLRMATRTLEKLTRWVQHVVPDLITPVPTPPDLSSVEGIWEMIPNNLRYFIGIEDEEPEHLPTPESAAFLTACSWNIFANRSGGQELEAIIEYTKEHLLSPYAVQALLTVIFCRDLFQSPEPMCGKAAPSLVAVYDMQRSISKSPHLLLQIQIRVLIQTQKILHQYSAWT
jgi:hypothetical protein